MGFVHGHRGWGEINRKMLKIPPPPTPGAEPTELNIFFPFKVIDICAEMKTMGHAQSLNLDLISADHLRYTVCRVFKILNFSQ